MTADVSVVGCGLIGSAVARAFGDAGLRVTVWNRTPERAQALESETITAVTDIREAVASAPLVVCTLDVPTSLRAALEPIVDWQGVTVANLVSTSRRQAEETAAWIEGRGGRYLDGGIFCYPADIGTETGDFVFSGAAELWPQHETALKALGRPTFTSTSVAMASVALSGDGAFYLPALAGFVGAMTYLRSEGASHDDMVRCIDRTLELLRRHTLTGLEAIETDHHETDQAQIAIYAAILRNGLAETKARGRTNRLYEAILGNLEEAIAAGLGDLGFYAQTKIL